MTLLFVVFFCLSIAVLTVKKPLYALGCIILFSPTYLIRFYVGQLPTTLLECMILTLFATWLWVNRSELYQKIQLFFKTGFLWRPRSVFDFCILFGCIFFISATCSVFFSPKPIAALGIWRAYFLEPVLFFWVLLSIVKTKKNSIFLLCAALISALVISFIAIMQTWFGWDIPLPYLLTRRATSVYSYPNAVGLFVGPLIAIAFGLGVSLLDKIKTSKEKSVALFFGISFIAFYLGIFAARSEAMIAAAFIACFFFLIFLNTKTKILACAVGIGLLAFFIIPSHQQSYIIEKMSLKKWSGFVRVSIWKETAPMLRDHWFTGAGLAGYQDVFKRYHTQKGVEIFLYPHTIVMNFWSETGLVGVVSFFAFVICFLRMMFKLFSDPEKKLLALCLFLSILTLLIQGLVDVPYFKNDLALFFWTLIGLGVVLHQEK